MNKICKECGAKMAENAKECSRCRATDEGNVNNAYLNQIEFVPTIEISRESSLVGWILSYRVFVDDIEIGKLKNGEKKRFQIAPGLHEIWLKQNWSWCYSPKVSFMLKDFVKFSCKPKIGVLGLLFGRDIFYVLFKRHKYIVLEED